MHVLVHHGRGIGGELADDLLEDVLERHQSLDVAVLVDHECHAALVALEIQELRIERRARRDEVGVARARGLDQLSRSSRPRASSCTTRFMCSTPMMRSMSPSYTGRRVCWL